MSRELAKLSLGWQVRWEPLERGRGEYARDQFDEFIASNLGFGLDNVVADKPGLDLRVGPCVVNLARGIVIVFLHLFDEIVAVLLIVCLD